MMNRIISFFKSHKGSLLSGLLVGTSFVPFPPWAIAFCWIPLWLEVSKENSLKMVFFKAWLSQFILTVIGFYWIAYVCHVFGFMPMPVAIGAMLLFAAGIHLYVPIAVTLARYLGKRFALSINSQIGLMALLHVMGEAYWPSMFTWNLAYPLYEFDFSIAQVADVFGFQGLSLFFHLINWALAWAWLNKKLELRIAVLAGCLALYCALSYWGSKNRQHWQQTDSQIKALVIQPSVGNAEKLMAEKGVGFRSEIVQLLFKQTEKGLEAGPVDFVVWPETAFPDFLGNHNHHRNYSSQFSDFVKKIQTPIVTGGYGNALPGEARAEYNTLQVYNRDGLAVDRGYNKTILLAFGEYTPFGDLFPILKKWNPGGEGWGKGSGPITLDLNGWKLGPQICYESLFPSFSAASAGNGAHILVNLTNDSWFGPYSEPYQNRIMTLARAIENRRPLIRSTNSGITSVALASGEKLESSPLFEEWSHTYTIPLKRNPELTLFTKYHWLLHPVLFLLFGVIFLFGRQKE